MKSVVNGVLVQGGSMSQTAIDAMLELICSINDESILTR